MKLALPLPPLSKNKSIRNSKIFVTRSHYIRSPLPPRFHPPRPLPDTQNKNLRQSIRTLPKLYASLDRQKAFAKTVFPVAQIPSYVPQPFFDTKILPRKEGIFCRLGG
jgi:hypothetical protein